MVCTAVAVGYNITEDGWKSSFYSSQSEKIIDKTDLRVQAEGEIRTLTTRNCLS